MNSSTEAATLRRRQADLGRRLDRLGDDSPGARGSQLARVIDLGDKSSTARSMVAVVPVRISVDQVEGATPTLAAGDDDTAFLALNLGSTAPPVGLDVILDLVDGIPVFRHD